MTDEAASSVSNSASNSDSPNSAASSPISTDSSWSNSSINSPDSESVGDSLDSSWGSSFDRSSSGWGGETTDTLSFEAHSSLWGGSDPSNWHTSNDWGSMRSGWSAEPAGDFQNMNPVEPEHIEHNNVEQPVDDAISSIGASEAEQIDPGAEWTASAEELVDEKSDSQ